MASSSQDSMSSAISSPSSSPTPSSLLQTNLLEQCQRCIRRASIQDMDLIQRVIQVCNDRQEFEAQQVRIKKLELENVAMKHRLRKMDKRKEYCKELEEQVRYYEDRVINLKLQSAQAQQTLDAQENPMQGPRTFEEEMRAGFTPQRGGKSFKMVPINLKVSNKRSRSVSPTSQQLVDDIFESLMEPGTEQDPNDSYLQTLRNRRKKKRHSEPTPRVQLVRLAMEASE